MAIIVQKYGGKTVDTIEKVKRIAAKIESALIEGDQMIIVVSAMGNTTDELIDLAEEISSSPSKREMDMLLSTGEQVSIALLAIALQERGVKATSLTGWQAGIETDHLHNNANILNVDTEKIEAHLTQADVVIVAGFQGIDRMGEITTLGRGGSDTTAVALAAVMNAARCEIYSDVSGVYTTDPRYVKNARKLDEISYDEMLELANLGANILHPRAVEVAHNYSIPLVVASSEGDESGTFIKEETDVEQHLLIRGIAFENDVTKITVAGLTNQIDILSTLFTSLAKNGINVDIIVQNQYDEKHVNISFSIKQSALKDTLNVLQDMQAQLGYSSIYHEDQLAKISIVGSGMVSNPGVAAKMFEVLANNDIGVKMVSTSEIKISTVVNEEHMITAIEELHNAFGLFDHAETLL